MTKSESKGLRPCSSGVESSTRTEDTSKVESSLRGSDVESSSVPHSVKECFPDIRPKQVSLHTDCGDDDNVSRASTAGTTNTSLRRRLLSRFQSASVLVNYISVGFILLPATFATGGILWTAICLALVSLQSYITGVFVLEACARAEALESVAILTSASRHGQRGLPRQYSCQIRERKFELSELCRYFMGRKLRNFFTLTTAGDLYGLTWALSAVFGSALADGIPLTANDENDYKLYVIIFMAIAVPLSCLPISDQIVLQMIFLTARLIMVALMIATTAVAYQSATPHFGNQIGAARDVPLFDFSSTITTLVMCVFSTAFQFSVPNLTNETKHKTQMVPVIRSSVSFVYWSNLILGVVLAIFFGLAIQDSSNLNWVDYHGGTWDGTGDLREGRTLWATVVSQYIVLFAAIDGLAVYPLCAISLGEILMGTFYEDRVHEMQDNWKVRTVFRLLASVPQAVGSIFVSDLGVIAKYAGIFTLLSYTVCPCLLNIFGRRRMITEELTENMNTYYHSVFSTSTWSWTLIVVSSLLITGVVVESFL